MQVVVSLGARPVAVPDVKGTTTPQQAAALRAAHQVARHVVAVAGHERAVRSEARAKRVEAAAQLPVDGGHGPGTIKTERVGATGG